MLLRTMISFAPQPVTPSYQRMTAWAAWGREQSVGEVPAEKEPGVAYRGAHDTGGRGEVGWGLGAGVWGA